MATPEGTLRERNRELTRSEIVRKAYGLFVRHGYENTSVEQIAAAAGISRATFFNYFPQKDLILREVASARSERLMELLNEARATAPLTHQDILRVILDFCAENAHFSIGAKALLLQTFTDQASRGLILKAREKVIAALADALPATSGSKQARGKQTRVISETFTAVYLATIMEWLMRTDVPEQWLVDTMRQRLEFVLGAVL